MRWPARAQARAEAEAPAQSPSIAGDGGRPGRRLSGLQRRFMAIVLAGSIGFALAAGVITYLVAHARAFDVGREEVEALLGAVGKTAAIGAYASDEVLIQEILQGLAGNPLIASAEVVDVAGRPLGRAGSPVSEAAASMVVAYPLVSPFDVGEAVGALRAVIRQARLESNARHTASMIAGLMVGQTALVALLLYLAASILVSRPIIRLAETLKNMEPGSIEPLTCPLRHANDEIGGLVASANALLAANAEALGRERQLRAAIEQMEAQYRQIFDSSSAGIFVLDAEGRLINGNPTVMRLIGRPVEEIRGLDADAFIVTVFARPGRVRDLIATSARTGETVSADLEVLHSDLQPRWVHCLISVQADDVAEHLVEGVMYDVTERKRQEAEVRHRAEHDGLTGLMNRASLDGALDVLIENAGPAPNPIAVLYLDLDGFKRINDGFGHKVGDKVLVECAGRLREVMGRRAAIKGALSARVGGDEFVIVLPGLDCAAPALAELAQSLISALQRPIAIDGGSEVRIGASVGIACFPRHGATRRSLLHAADLAMYEVKRNGRNSFAVALEAATGSVPVATQGI